MKRTLTLLSLIAVFCTTTYSQEKNSAVMVKKIFSSLQRKDEKAFVRLFPDAATMRAFIQKIYASDSLVNGNEDVLHDLTARITDSSMREKFINSFRDIISTGEKKGVDWSEAKFVSYLADSTFETESRTSVLNGKIYFTSNKKDYFLSYGQIIWFDKLGWYGVEVDRIDEKYKENDPEEFVWDGNADSTAMMDSATLEVDTTVIAPEKPKPEKPIQKKMPDKNKPAKAKSATPILKPE
jgi:hypothetical protein